LYSINETAGRESEKRFLVLFFALKCEFFVRLMTITDSISAGIAVVVKKFHFYEITVSQKVTAGSI